MQSHKARHGALIHYCQAGPGTFWKTGPPQRTPRNLPPPTQACSSVGVGTRPPKGRQPQWHGPSCEKAVSGPRSLSKRLSPRKNWVAASRGPRPCWPRRRKALSKYWTMVRHGRQAGEAGLEGKGINQDWKPGTGLFPWGTGLPPHTYHFLSPNRVAVVQCWGPPSPHKSQTRLFLQVTDQTLSSSHWPDSLFESQTRLFLRGFSDKEQQRQRAFRGWLTVGSAPHPVCWMLVSSRGAVPCVTDKTVPCHDDSLPSDSVIRL